MSTIDAIYDRHSVRQYKNQPLSKEVIHALRSEIDACNQESGLHIQLVTNEPKAFDSFMAHYGKFKGVTNYLALVGKKEPSLEEKCGYFGEKLVLFAQELGLNTCWVAMTYSKIKTAFQVGKGEKLCIVIALGYGETQGVPHKSKSMEEVVQLNGPVPEWFQKGVQAALLAPTAINQQKLLFRLDKNRVSVKAGFGFNTKIDMGIVKYHFEIGAGKEHFQWELS